MHNVNAFSKDFFDMFQQKIFFFGGFVKSDAGKMAKMTYKTGVPSSFQTVLSKKDCELFLMEFGTSEEGFLLLCRIRLESGVYTEFRDLEYDLCAKSVNFQVTSLQRRENMV